MTVCCNLLVLDEVSNYFRFAHLSVQEYFQSDSDFDERRVHEIVLTRCIDIFIADAKTFEAQTFEAQLMDSFLFSRKESPRLRVYAVTNWMHHRSKTESLKCRGRVKRFLFRDSEFAPTFESWTYPSTGHLERAPYHYYMSSFRELICTPLTPLLLACRLGWDDVLEHLNNLTHTGRDQPGEERTAANLKFVIRPGLLDIVHWLLAVGVDFNTSQHVEEQLLAEDVSRRNCQAIERLLAAGMKVGAVDHFGRTALSSLGLARTYDIATARMLMSADANPDIADYEGKTALGVLFETILYQPFSSKESVDGIELLLSKVTNINNIDRGIRIMRWAAENGHVSVASLLIEAKYEINAVDDDGWTALNRAALSGQVGMVTLLLAVEQVDINLTASDGWTPIRSATSASNSQIVQMLIQAGADVNRYTDGHSTALFQAAEHGYIDILQILIAAGADVKIDISAKGVASRLAAGSGNLDMFSNLLVDGGALDAVDRLCHTALHVAAKNGHLEVVEALLEAISDVNYLNNFGWKASDLAAEWGHHHIAQILLAAEAKTQTSIVPFKKYSQETDWRFREWDEEDEDNGILQEMQSVTV